VVSGFTNFSEAIALNKLCRGRNIPFYTLNVSGLFGFYFTDLGSELNFTHHKKATDTDEQHQITDSKTLDEWLAAYTKQGPFTWKARAIQKTDKYILLSILAKWLQES
jgi:hypothetical protein